MPAVAAAAAARGLLVGDVDGAFRSACSRGSKKLRVGGVNGGELMQVSREARPDEICPKFAER